MKTTMIVAAVALVFGVVGCASAQGDEDPGTSEGELTGRAYCDVDKATGLLTGQCRGGYNMCSLAASSLCPAGAAARSNTVDYGSCGEFHFDPTKACK